MYFLYDRKAMPCFLAGNRPLTSGFFYLKYHIEPHPKRLLDTNLLGCGSIDGYIIFYIRL